MSFTVIEGRKPTELDEVIAKFRSMGPETALMIGITEGEDGGMVYSIASMTMDAAMLDHLVNILRRWVDERITSTP